MRPSLKLQVCQQLTLTPQLQQAIRLLQLSTQELNAEIQEMLETNPMLEIEDPSVDCLSEGLYSNPAVSKLSNLIENFPQDTHKAATPTLKEHLIWQMQLTPFTEKDIAIATALIDAINDDGMITSPLIDIKTGIDYPGEDIELDEIETVLKRIQHFDPVGVASRSVQESLLIQLQHVPPHTPFLSKSIDIISKHMELLAKKEHKKIARQCKLSHADFNECLLLIRSLNPRPGAHITNAEPEYITPDLILKKINDAWKIELYQGTLPNLRINNYYASLAGSIKSTGDATYLRNNLQEARWFLKSLQSRNETLLKVASNIVEKQHDFLEYGDEAMKPLVLRDIAEAIGMHESTISRVTTRKYMHTPRGIFELKYFFSSHVGTQSGGECSSTAIRAIIKKLVAAENANKPLSDHRIATYLNEQGINVARRTIAKYREAMAIPPSNERKVSELI